MQTSCSILKLKQCQKYYSYQNCQRNSTSKILGRVKIKKQSLDTTSCKLFATKSSFHMKYRTTGIFYLLFLDTRLLVLTKFLFFQGAWVLGSHSMKFRHFLNIYYFPKILSLKSFGNSRCNSWMPCLCVTIAHPFTCSQRLIWQNIKKSQNIMNLIVWKFFFCFLCFY